MFVLDNTKLQVGDEYYETRGERKETKGVLISPALSIFRRLITNTLSYAYAFKPLTEREGVKIRDPCFFRNWIEKHCESVTEIFRCKCRPILHE